MAAFVHHLAVLSRVAAAAATGTLLWGVASGVSHQRLRAGVAISPQQRAASAVAVSVGAAASSWTGGTTIGGVAAETVRRPTPLQTFLLLRIGLPAATSAAALLLIDVVSGQIADVLVPAISSGVVGWLYYGLARHVVQFRSCMQR